MRCILSLRHALWVVPLLLIGTISAAAPVYEVQDGDTLSHLAGKFLKYPIYGRDGTLEKLRKLNPEILNLDQIYAGQKIYFGDGEILQPEARVALEEPPSVASRSPASTPELPALPPSTDTQSGFSHLEFTPELVYSRIDGIDRGNGSKGKLISRLSYGGTFQYTQLWSDHFHTYLEAGSDQIQFTSATNKTIQNASQMYSHYGLGTEFRLSDQTWFGLGAGESDEIFYHATGVNTIVLDSVPVANVNASLKQSIYTSGPFTLGGEAKGSYLFSTSTEDYTIATGYSYQADLFVTQESPKSQLSLTSCVFYKFTSQNTSLLDETRKDLGIQFGIRWNFGK